MIMDINELLVNLRAEFSKLQALLQKLGERIYEIETFCEEQGLLEKDKKTRLRR